MGHRCGARHRVGRARPGATRHAARLSTSQFRPGPLDAPGSSRDGYAEEHYRHADGSTTIIREYQVDGSYHIMSDRAEIELIDNGDPDPRTRSASSSCPDARGRRLPRGRAVIGGAGALGVLAGNPGRECLVPGGHRVGQRGARPTIPGRAPAPPAGSQVAVAGAGWALAGEPDRQRSWCSASPESSCRNGKSARCSLTAACSAKTQCPARTASSTVAGCCPAWWTCTRIPGRRSPGTRSRTPCSAATWPTRRPRACCSSGHRDRRRGSRPGRMTRTACPGPVGRPVAGYPGAVLPGLGPAHHRGGTGRGRAGRGHRLGHRDPARGQFGGGIRRRGGGQCVTGRWGTRHWGTRQAGGTRHGSHRRLVQDHR